jgi:hypothetical protein
MPAETLRVLGDLAKAGAKVVFQDSLPTSPNGYSELKRRRAEFSLELSAISREGLVTVTTPGSNPTVALGLAGEPMARQGLRFVRRKLPDGAAYFVVNQSTNEFDGWLPLGSAGSAVAVLDPLARAESGWAKVRSEGGLLEARLRMLPGASLILKMSAEPRTKPKWNVEDPAGRARAITGTWSLSFYNGDQVPPKSYTTDRLESWTLRDDPEAKRFAGTVRYSIEFERPTSGGEALDWLLDLGTVADSARVRINGRELAPLFCPPFQIPVGRWLVPGTNRLEVDVTNVAANRVRDLDVRKVKWKYFEDANVVGKNYKPLDASLWPVRDAGLLGPVTLMPMATTQ